MTSSANVKRRALTLFVLASLAMTLPMYGLLKSNPAFIAAHQFDHLDMMLLVGVLALVLPTVPVLIWLLVDRLSRRVGRWLFSTLMVVMVALLILGVISAWSLHPIVALLMSVLLGLLAAALFRRWTILPVFMTWYAWVLPVMLLLFVSHDAIRPFFKSSSASVTASRLGSDDAPPIFMVVFDELPQISLLTSEPQHAGSDKPGFVINPRRFPNLAALAETASWYPWHSSNSDTTSISIPTLLSGRLPEGAEITPSWQQVPVNLYTVLANHYSMNVFENGTNLCPQTICMRRSVLSDRSGRWRLMLDDLWISFQHRVVPSRWRHALIPIDNRWLAFRDPINDGVEPSGSFSKDHYDFADRGEVFRRFIEQGRTQINQEGGTPSLNLIHSMLPHAPFKRLPEGWFYTLPESTQFLGTLKPSAQTTFMHQLYEDPQAMLLSRQQHLLQLGFADTLIGELVTMLKAEGVYDQSLIIVTSDHGASFTPGFSRRQIHQGNQSEIASVPLLIKYPGQHQGSIETKDSQSIDVLPTILDVAGLTIEHELSGLSLRSGLLNREHIQIQAGGYRQETMQRPSFRAAISDKVAAFDQQHGSGSLGQLYDLQVVGAPDGWIGQPQDLIPVGATTAVPALRVAQLNAMTDWSPADNHRLSVLYAEHDESASDQPLPEGLMFSINGTVACLARYLRLSGLEHQTRCLFDYRLFNPGPNTVQIHPLARVNDQWVRGQAIELIHAERVTGTRTPVSSDIRQVTLHRLPLSDVQSVETVETYPLLNQGWANEPGAIRWTVERETSLRHPLVETAPPGQYRLLLRAKVLTEPEKLPVQRVRIRLNQGEWIEQRWQESDFADYAVPLILEQTSDEFIIDFQLPDAASPQSLGLGEDTRLLGFALLSWQISPVESDSN